MLKCTGLLDADIQAERRVGNKNPGILFGRLAQHVVHQRIDTDMIEFIQPLGVMKLCIYLIQKGRRVSSCLRRIGAISKSGNCVSCRAGHAV